MSNVALFRPVPQAKNEDFEAFWAVYPRRKEKLEALRRWRDAIRIASPVDIIEGAIRYAKTAQEPYIKLPATWLHKGCWMDEDATEAAPMASPQEARANMKTLMEAKAVQGNKFAQDWLKRNS